MQPLEANRWGGAYPDDRSAIADFTALLVRIATELVDDGMSRSYNQLREALLSNPEYVDVLPRVLREARTAGQFQAIVNREVNVDQDVTALVLSLFQDLAQRAYQLSSGDVRVTEDGDFRVTEDGDVRLTEDGEILLAEDGTPLLDEDGNPIEAEGTGGAAAEEGRTTREIASNWRDYFFTSDNGDPKEPRGDSANTDAASWTGVPSRAARLVAVRGQIEAAHEAIGYLIDEISADGGNGGPLLDEHGDALTALRELHRTLGSLLEAIDQGRLNDAMGEGFAAELARFGLDTVASLRDNRARYIVAAMTFATLSACGLADWGGMAGGAVLGIPKRLKETKQGRADGSD